MDYELSSHALVQMVSRDITEDAVITALVSPYNEQPGKRPGRRVYDGIVRGRGIRVVISEIEQPPRIVSVMVRRIP